MQHALRGVQGNDQRSGVAALEGAGGVARPRPSIDHDAGSQRRPLEPRQKILAHLGVQNG